MTVFDVLEGIFAAIGVGVIVAGIVLTYVVWDLTRKP